MPKPWQIRRTLQATPVEIARYRQKSQLAHGGHATRNQANAGEAAVFSRQAYKQKALQRTAQCSFEYPCECLPKPKHLFPSKGKVFRADKDIKDIFCFAEARDTEVRVRTITYSRALGLLMKKGQSPSSNVSCVLMASFDI